MCGNNKHFHINQLSDRCELKQLMETKNIFQPIKHPHVYSCPCGTSLQIEHTYTICPTCEAKYVIHPNRCEQSEYILKVGLM
ncbi:MAG: hypothetical protein ACRCST_07760 [Turicibacter sp.]